LTGSHRNAPPVEELVPGQEYRVLSVHPQWAWAIIFGGKDVENRSWSTGYRGRVLVHASSRRASADQLAQDRVAICRNGGLSADALPSAFERSAIIGSIEVVDCVQRSRSMWAYPGNTFWMLREPRALAPPIKSVHGKLGRWTADGSATMSSSRATGDSPAPTLAPRLDPSSAVLVSPRLMRAEQHGSIEDIERDEIMAAMQKVASTRTMEERELLRSVSRQLGFARMGSRVQARLEKELRHAIKRQVLARDGRELRLVGISGRS
jgi:ASCH domain